MSESIAVIIQDLIMRLQEGDDNARSELIGGAQRRLEQLTRKMLKQFSRVRR